MLWISGQLHSNSKSQNKANEKQNKHPAFFQGLPWNSTCCHYDKVLEITYKKVARSFGGIILWCLGFSVFGPVITETIMVGAWSRSCSLHGPWEAKREPVSPLKACPQWVNSILLISPPQTPPPHPKCLSGFQHYSQPGDQAFACLWRHFRSEVSVIATA